MPPICPPAATALDWQHAEIEDEPAAASIATVVLKRSGCRPMRFDGTLLTQATSWTPERPLWFEGAIYETVEGRFVVALSAFHKAPERPDRHSTWLCESAGEAAQEIRNYDPDQDVWTGTIPDLEDPAPFDPEQQTDLLRGAIENARDAFNAMIRTLLPEEAGHL